MEAAIKLDIIFVIKRGKWICLSEEKSHLLRKTRIMANDKNKMYFVAPLNFPLKASPCV